MANINWDDQYNQAIADENWDLASQLLGDLPDTREQELTQEAKALEDLFRDVDLIGD